MRDRKFLYKILFLNLIGLPKSMTAFISFIVLMTIGTAYSPEKTKTYDVKKINGPIVLTGKGESAAWKKANELTDFAYPWESGAPQATSFKALHNEEWLYCLFKVRDDSIRVYVDTNEKREAVRSDRVEIFFKKDDRMAPYYCLEIDPMARVFDCKGDFYRKLDTNWSWPANDLVVKTDIAGDIYTIEIAISKKSLASLELLANNTLQAGIFRADCIELTGKEAKFRWISWIIPQSETPDFHIPSAFGTLKLND
jgi:hypothetical protein